MAAAHNWGSYIHIGQPSRGGYLLLNKMRNSFKIGLYLHTNTIPPSPYFTNAELGSSCNHSTSWQGSRHYIKVKLVIFYSDTPL